jgi:cytochrome c553
MFSKQTSKAVSIAMLLGGMLMGSAAEAADGSELAWKYRCITCHGERGKSREPRYPNLAGQNAPYLEARLKYFRAYTEAANQMNAQAAPLSDDDIAALAEHFSSMPR